jgi:hypothetical protein
VSGIAARLLRVVTATIAYKIEAVRLGKTGGQNVGYLTLRWL